MASIEQSGLDVAPVIVPYQLIFTPTLVLQKLLPEADKIYDFRELLNNRGMQGDDGIVLYKVQGRVEKKSPLLRNWPYRGDFGFYSFAIWG